MKSYTDIKQSKKLAKMLSVKSADMCLTFVDNVWNPVWGKASDIYQLQKDCYEPDYTKDEYIDIDEFKPKVVPAWSLVALICILPKFIEFKGNKYYLRFMKEYVEYANDEFSITGRCLHTIGNNLVDACYEMIIKLKELNLL